MGFNPSGGKIANATDVALGAHATIADGHTLTYSGGDGLWENRAGATTYNVKNFGAIGDGVTDDTAAVAACRDAMLAGGISSGIYLFLQGAMYFPSGTYLIKSQDTLMYSPTTSSAGAGMQSLRGLVIEGDNSRSSIIAFQSTGTLSSDLAQNNLLTLANRARGMRIKHLQFTSNNAAQSFLYAWCDAGDSSDPSNANATKPQYGIGAQNDWEFEDVFWTGSWNRVCGFDGGVNANQNSEISWIKCYINDPTTFADAAFHIGFNTVSYFTQEDQFLDYYFTDCEFEYASGNLIQVEMGGHVHARGGSWILGIGNSSTNAGTFFATTHNGSHASNVQHLNVDGTRFEFRTNQCHLLSTTWRSSSAHIVFRNISVATDYFSHWSQDPSAWSLLSYTLGSGDVMPLIAFEDCELDGYFNISLATDEAAPGGGGLYFNRCNHRTFAAGLIAGGAATTVSGSASMSSSSNSTQLTCTGASFTQSDVGKGISVSGAGSGGAFLISTIASVTSSTTAVLGNTAKTTVSGQTIRYGTAVVKASTGAPNVWSKQSRGTAERPVNFQAGTTYTIGMGDNEGAIHTATGSGITITVPSYVSAGVGIQPGFYVEIVQAGGGQVTIAAGSGVTIETAASMTTRTQWSAIGLRQFSPNNWILTGDLT
jgi:hypothetical protein